MAEIIISCIIILHASSIALGVGGSTLAIASYLVALRDNMIDPSERRMLGVIYLLLRSAMILILTTAVAIAWFRPDIFGGSTVFLFVLIAILYVNAYLMTKHAISIAAGPALQAATWYTLGFVVSITMFQLFDLTPLGFLLLYAGDIILAFLIVAIAARLRR